MVEIPLIWPKYAYKTKNIGSKKYIYDPLRKKYVFLTPEEWVRQHVVNYLQEEKKYPRGLIKIESGLDFNSMKKRSDILVCNSEGNSQILIECKAPSIKINQSSINQAGRYNFNYKAPILLITNGLSNFLYKIFWDENRTENLNEIPSFLDT